MKIYGGNRLRLNVEDAEHFHDEWLEIDDTGNGHIRFKHVKRGYILREESFDAEYLFGLIPRLIAESEKAKTNNVKIDRFIAELDSLRKFFSENRELAEKLLKKRK